MPPTCPPPWLGPLLVSLPGYSFSSSLLHKLLFVLQDPTQNVTPLIKSYLILLIDQGSAGCKTKKPTQDSLSKKGNMSAYVTEDSGDGFRHGWTERPKRGTMCFPHGSASLLVMIVPEVPLGVAAEDGGQQSQMHTPVQ